MIGVLVVTAGWWYVTEGVGLAIAVVGVPGAVGGAAARQRLRRTGWSGRPPGWVELECLSMAAVCGRRVGPGAWASHDRERSEAA